MDILLVVENPARWPLDIPGTQVVAARDYLTDSSFVERRRARVFNLCRTYGYQTTGYYVSLLAAARGHRPLPSVTTIQDIRESAVVRIVSEDIQDVLQRALAGVDASRHVIDLYFGRNPDPRYDRLGQALFEHFPAPLLRAELIRSDEWRLAGLRPIAASDIPELAQPFVVERARKFFERPRVTERKEQARYDFAILLNPDEVDAPSDDRAIALFERAAEKLGMDVTMLEREDIGRIAEFDALFIRETTTVNHHTYRFARRAEAEGLVVIDDPASIVRCSNKVYQAELFQRLGIAIPKTLVVHKDNASAIGRELGFPCVLKRPDSSFSAGVVKAADEAELAKHLEAFFDLSELVVAQAFSPSRFDWRIGVLGGKALYACRYHMARGHWQIQKEEPSGRRRYGKTETLPIAEAPQSAVELALRACAPMGESFYGVDIKELDGRFVVMEVNDNPSVEAGYEDEVLGEELYLAVMRHFYERLERRGR